MAAERFGPYRLDELIGRGGMGEVWRAYDTARDRTVALKRLHRHLVGDAAFQSQFRRESQIVARLREPHIIPIHDFGAIDGQLFIDMRLVDGVDLSTLLQQRGPLPPSRAAMIVVQLAGALAAAHAENLVHRDVKPANVLVVGAERAEDHVYLVDFGVARDVSATEFGPAGALVGSAEYMAPEQFAKGQADHLADIYALGGLLYTALTAATPFPADGAAAQMYAHLHSPPPTPSARRPGLPRGLDRIVTTAMAKRPEERHQSAIEFAADVRAALTDAEPARAGTSKEPNPAWPLAVGAMRALDWSANPPIGELARRVADQAAAVAGSLGIPTLRARPHDHRTSREPEGPSAHPGPSRLSTDATEPGGLGISLFVAEAVSKKAISTAAEMFWTTLRPAMAAARNTLHDDPPQVGDTVVLKTVFGEGSQRTVIEVRVPVTAAQRPDLDLDRILSDAYAAANAQNHGDLRGKHVMVDTDRSARGPTVVAVRDASTETTPADRDRPSP